MIGKALRCGHASRQVGETLGELSELDPLLRLLHETLQLLQPVQLGDLARQLVQFGSRVSIILFELGHLEPSVLELERQLGLAVTLRVQLGLEFADTNLQRADQVGLNLFLAKRALNLEESLASKDEIIVLFERFLNIYSRLEVFVVGSFGAQVLLVCLQVSG
jgi:hypothetical protein